MYPLGTQYMTEIEGLLPKAVPREVWNMYKFYKIRRLLGLGLVGVYSQGTPLATPRLKLDLGILGSGAINFHTSSGHVFGRVPHPVI